MVMLKRPLSLGELEVLRVSVDALRSHDRGSLPHDEFVRLSAASGESCGVAIDFTATEILGAPVVVLKQRFEPQSADWFSKLSPRERQVVGLVARGLANKEIAARLSITVGTVKDHIHRILGKTELPNRAALAAGAGQTE
jgi:DNA-binding NarL/FixJ family response regulator